HWYSPGNVSRLERTAELARRREVRPVNVALAWVLHQPFTVFPVIGPRLASELHTALAALGLDLSPDELAWLDVGEGPR
ncbi:MAG: aldo/keto reductase, partial [Acidimicrobiia bacterium]